MAGRVQWEAQVDSNVAKLLSETKELRDQLDGIKKGNYEIKLNIDDKKLEKVISNLDKMLESLGKGTGDFKEFENLSKQLNEIVSEVKELNKAFGGINDSGVSNLLSSIQSIDKSLSSLSEHITNVNKDFGSVGKNASDNVGQINEAKKATEGLTEATRELANAQKNVGNKSNISSPIKDTFQGKKIEQATTSAKELDKTLEQAVDVPTDKFDEILSKLDLTESKLGKIARITKQMHIDENGKPVESYTLKDKYGSTEIYGESSNKATKQLLSANYVEYDSKQAEKESKELLAVEKEITKEIEKQEKAQASAQKKKWQAFENEQKKYVSDQKKTTDIEKNKSAYQELLDTIKQYSEVSKRIAKNETLDGDLKLAQKLENKISELQKNPILSSSQIAKSERDLVNLFNQLDTLEKKTTKKQSDKSSAQSAKEQAEAWEKNVKAIQEYMDANTKLNNLKAQDKGSGKYTSRISDQQKEVERLREAALEARIALSSMINPNTTSVEDWGKWVESVKQFEQATMGSTESIAKLEDAMGNLKKSQLDSMQSSIDGFQTKADDYSLRENKSDTYIAKIQELKNAIKELSEFRLNLANSPSAITDKELSKFEELETKAKGCSDAIKNMSASAKGSSSLSRAKEIDTITKYLENNTRISKRAKEQLKEYLDILRNRGASANVEEIHKKFLDVATAERLAKREGKSFFDIFKDKTLYGYAAQLANYYLSLYDFIRYARYGINVVIEIDTALTELRKVSDATEQRLSQNFKNSAETAKELGASISDVISASADWSRMGFDIDESEELARVSTLYVNVGDGIDVEEANNSLISTLQGFQMDAEEAESIVDRFNEVANNYAIDSAGIGEALQRSAASFNAANTDLSKSIALITATRLQNWLNAWKHVLRIYLIAIEVFITMHHNIEETTI